MRFVDLSLGGALGGKVFLCHLWLRPQVDQKHFLFLPLDPMGPRVERPPLRVVVDFLSLLLLLQLVE